MTAIFVADCSCEGFAGGRAGWPERHTSDESAMWSALRHWQLRLQVDDNHRYWSVHGPSGHVIGLRGTPVGDLPPR